MLDPVNVTAQERDALLSRRAVPQRALERRPPAQQRHRSALGRGRDRCTGGDEVIKHVRHLRPHRVDDLTAECVCVMELHDALALPRGCWARRTRVAVDDDHLTPPAGEGDRGEQAGQTRPDDKCSRRSIVSAATRLFVEDGYGSTTINAVAEAAGVSRKTVFTAVGGKLDLLKLTLDWSVAGDDQAVALSDRAAIRKLVDQPDPRGVLSGLVALLVAIGTRVAPLYVALEVAASMDPAARDLVEESQRRRLDDAHKVVGRLRDLDALTTHITYQEAVDVVWLAMDPAIFDRLVGVRGWTASRFEEWLVDTLCRQLLG